MSNISQIVTWASVGLVLLVLLFGFFAGLRRGWKRAVMHLGFGVVAVICALFLTRGTTSKLLDMTLTINGEDVILSDYILSLLGVDISSLDTATEFVSKLPAAILNPILFLVFALLVYFVFHIIYLIVARIFFGTKKEDFKIKNHKPHRLIGSAIGMIEGAVLLIVLVSPLMTLSNTYEEIVNYSTVSTSAFSLRAAQGDEGKENSNHLSTISELIGEYLPSEANEVVSALNSSLLGKISSTTGIGNLMFDALSNIKIDGEKINFRTEIVTVCQTYDEFVVFYNDLTDGNYESLDFSNLKECLTKVFDNNLFKVVVSNTLNEFIINYDYLDEQLNLSDSLGDFTYLIDNLKEKCQTANFSLYEYLRSDLMTVLDVVDNAVELGVVKQLKDTQEFNVETVLSLLEKNSDFVKSSLNSVFNLNLVKDSMSSLARVMSNQLASYEIDGVALNPNMSEDDIDKLSSSLSTVVDYLCDLDISGVVSIINADDKLVAIANLNSETLYDTLVLMGEILDEFDQMPLLNYTDSSQQNVNVLTNLLNNYNLNLLGDEVYMTKEDAEKEQTTALDSYTDFFTYMAEPLKKLSDAGLLKAVASGSFEFDDVKTSLLNEICGTETSEGNTSFIADILMPFYQLDEYAKFDNNSLKDSIFSLVITTLDDSLSSFVSIELEGEDDTYLNYYTNLTSVGELIDVLNGEYVDVVNGEYTSTQTYLDYILDKEQTPNYLTLVKNMNAAGDLYNMLIIVFDNDMYAPLHIKLFTAIDDAVEGITDVNPASTYSNLNTNSDAYARTVCNLIDVVLNYDSEKEITEQLELVGELMDDLKDGASDNAFVEVFENFIWYLTGDVIDPYNETKYNGASANEYASYVQKYLANEDGYAENGYYGVSYANVMSNVQTAVSLANTVTSNLESVTEKLETINWDDSASVEEVVTSIYDAVTDIFSTTDTETGETTLDVDSACAIIEKAVDMGIDFDSVLGLTTESGDEGTGETSSTITDYSEQIESAIDKLVEDATIDSDIAESLKNLLGITSLGDLTGE